MPLLTPTTFFVTVITVINALQAFDLVYLMIGKTNPALEKSQTVVYLFYEKGFVERQGGYAAAIAFVLLALILVFTAFQFRSRGGGCTMADRPRRERVGPKLGGHARWRTSC